VPKSFFEEVPRSGLRAVIGGSGCEGRGNKYLCSILIAGVKKLHPSQQVWRAACATNPMNNK